jgi:hypothetical protein
LPPGLIKDLVNEPKDVALAIRVAPGPSSIQDQGVDAGPVRSSGTDSNEEWKDVFEEVGFEVVDEVATPEDDDERRESSLHVVSWCLTQHAHSHSHSAIRDHPPDAHDAPMAGDGPQTTAERAGRLGSPCPA